MPKAPQLDVGMEGQNGQMQVPTPGAKGSLSPGCTCSLRAWLSAVLGQVSSFLLLSLPRAEAEASLREPPPLCGHQLPKLPMVVMTLRKRKDQAGLVPAT